MRAPVSLSVGSSAQVAEVLPGRLYFACIRQPDAFRSTDLATKCKCYNSEGELVYEPFASDFGPLNLGSTFRFCQRLTALLQAAAQTGRPVCYCCGSAPARRANAAVLVGAYLVLIMGWSAEQACHIICSLAPFASFKDASNLPSTFQLTVEDCIKGLAKARDVGLLSWQSTPCTWNLAEYEFYEQVENGDLNWIIPGKFLAFSGPQGIARYYCGFRAKQPEDYWQYFQSRNVTGIVRLNNKVYESQRFIDGGFHHYELYFPDGTTPPDSIVDAFLHISETEPGALAVHCKAGLGRTGLLLCCYMMKHYCFTAHEAIGYIRVCRPGSVIGCQQQWLEEHEAPMHQAGRLLRKQLSAQGSFGKGQTYSITADARASAPASSLIKSHSGPIPPVTPPQRSGSRSIEVTLPQTSSKGTPLMPRPATARVMSSQPDLISRSQSDNVADRDGTSSPSSRLSAYLRSKTASFKGLSGRPASVAPQMPPQQQPGPTIPPPAPLAKQRSGGQVKLLAPNGQPRKLPAALIAAGAEAMELYAADEEIDRPESCRMDWSRAPGAVTRSMAKNMAPDMTNFSPLGSGLVGRF